jgi:hypothetical protein
VAEQLRRMLPHDCKVTLLAVDGAVARDLAGQTQHVPFDATHLFVSVGGNDALSNAWMINDTEGTTRDGFRHLAQAQQQFRRDYQLGLGAVLARRLPASVCTIYDGVPGLAQEELTALSVWNDVIQSEAFRAGVPVLDLRLICSHPKDYSSLSPIEPSEHGGAKIAAAILRVTAGHDFGRAESVVYGAALK